MEWKSSADKEKYGDMIGEVIHHTLFEDGTITKYDVKFGNKTIKNIPTEMLEVVEAQEHMHAATDDNIKGIYLNSSFVMAGFAQLEEIRNALIKFKESGKPVIAYAETFSET